MNQNLAHQRCFNHEEREAVARCPECKRHFCRECITEHDDRVICAACLKNLSQVPLLKRRGFVGAIRFAECVLGIFIVWFFFYLIGEGLLSMPDSFHESEIWNVNWIHKE